MDTISALLLGVLQGITEFFPVSSSAHLKLFKELLGVDQEQVLFDLTCHLGTLCALIYFLRKEITAIFHDWRKGIPFLIALIPLVPAYFLFKPLRTFFADVSYLGYFLLATSAILYLGEKWRPKPITKKLPQLLTIGFAQSLALLPGISRSASSISAARILGWNPKEAVRFSFLLSIPTVLGGNLLESLKMAKGETPLTIELFPLALAFLSSFVVGMIAVRFALYFLEKGRLKPFAWYCMGLGTMLLIFVHA